ncbi:hypothetical protein J6590_091512, partial [Homalodisca vitripennis]
KDTTVGLSRSRLDILRREACQLSNVLVYYHTEAISPPNLSFPLNITFHFSASNTMAILIGKQSTPNSNTMRWTLDPTSRTL